MYISTSNGDVQLSEPVMKEHYEDPTTSPSPSPAVSSELNRFKEEMQKRICDKCDKHDCDCKRSKKWLWIFSMIIIVLVCIVLWLLYEDGSLSSVMSSFSSKSSKSKGSSSKSR
jgi:hypothetical protein